MRQCQIFHGEVVYGEDCCEAYSGGTDVIEETSSLRNLKRKINRCSVLEMRQKRSDFEGAECLSGRGYNVDDDEVNRRAGHVAVSHAGRILVWGGYETGLPTEQSPYGRHRYWRTDWFMVLDPIAGIWKPQKTNPENCPPLTSGATGAVIDDVLYIFCGHTIRFERYEFPLVDPNKQEGSHPLLIEIFQEMHQDLIEENSNELYACDLTARPYPTWKRLNLTCLGLPPLSCDKLSNFVYNDKIYLFGGYGPRPASDIRFALPRSTTWIVDPTQRRGWNNQLVIYDPLKNEYTWPKTKGKEPTPRAAHAMAIDSDKKIAYVFGGRFGETRTNELYELHLEDMTWVLIHGQTDDRLVDAIQRPCGRSWHSLNFIQPTQFSNLNTECDSCSKSLIILYGGYGNDEETLYDCWLLDPSKDDIPRQCSVHPNSVSKRWTRLRHLERGDKFGRRMWHCGVTLSHGVMIIGGYGTNLPISDRFVDHPSRVLELLTTPKNLYECALDATCKLFSSLELTCNKPILDKDIKLDYKTESYEIPELLPGSIWKDVERKYPKYQYDTALSDMDAKNSKKNR